MAQTTRRWPTAAQMADRLDARMDSVVGLPPAIRARVKEEIAGYYSGLGHTIERKLSRLTEKLKDAIEAERFGPLFVDDAGNPIDKTTVTDPTAPGVNPTQAYQIWRAFRDIYSKDVLDSVDEEGELL